MVFESRKTPPRQLDQPGALVQPVRRQGKAALAPPGDQAFEQVAVGAPDVEEVPILRDGVKDGLALGPPADRTAVEPGLLD